jgi:hypothetical protein
MWYTHQEWLGDNTLPVAFQILPKKCVSLPGFEIFIPPTYERNLGANIVSYIFRASIEGIRFSNRENSDSFI